MNKVTLEVLGLTRAKLRSESLLSIWCRQLMSPNETAELLTVAEEKSIEERIIRYMNGAARTWDEMVGCLAGAPNPTSPDLTEEEYTNVHKVCVVLGDMFRTGKVSRTCDSDPKYDLYAPVKKA